MKKENFSDQAIKEKLSRLYKKSPLYRPRYNGAKVDTDMTPQKKPNAQFIPTKTKKPLMHYETIDSVNREKQPILTFKKKRKVQTSDGYLLT